MAALKPYNGSRRQLVIAFDVGTTFSGISYSILDPGQIPEIKGVTKYPAQEVISGSSKIPSIIYYDQQGKVRAVGAEAIQDGIFETAEDEGWVKTEWFKLHLRPTTPETRHLNSALPPLPLNKSVVQIFADFFCYLFKCVKSYIIQTHPTGGTLWTSLEDNIQFVLSHPNGWEGYQQSQMREASLLAGLIPNDQEAQARITFVTEGEASLHFALRNGFPKAVMDAGEGVLIVDAGGGTIDISTYVKTAQGSFEEIAAPQCHFHGSIFISVLAKTFLEDHLAESQYLDDIDHIVNCFDKTTKLRFKDNAEPQFIRFGSNRDTDVACGIRHGQLKLSGEKVASFFEPSLKCVVSSVVELHQLSKSTFSHVVTVGGFAASDYLYAKVVSELQPRGFHVVRPDHHLNKAVSDGAISFYLDHFVRMRVAKMTYGSFKHITYNPFDSEHVERKNTGFVDVDGATIIPGSFTTTLAKNTQVSETKEFRSHFWKVSRRMTGFSEVTMGVWCYRGLLDRPRWLDVDPTMYMQLCTIHLDLTHLTRNPASNIVRIESADGAYYHMDFDLVLVFGSTELKAQIAWKENEIEKRTPAKIVYDVNTLRDD